MNYRHLQIVLLLLFFFPTHLFGESIGKLEVSVSIPPQKWLCEQLGKDRLITHLLIDKGQEPHAFEPSPRQIQALSKSSIYFTTGMEFEKEIIRRLQTGAPQLQIVDTSQDIVRIPMEGQSAHAHDGGAVPDPHVWLSPLNLKSMAAAMAVALISIDSDNEGVYQKNLEELNVQLDHLDTTVAEGLDPFKGASFFVFHPAFGYFANRYHLQQIAVETGGKAPTPRQLFSLIKRAKAEEVRVIFVQPQFDPRSAERIAKAIGGKVVSLDPLAENSVANIKIMAVKITAALSGQDK